MWVQVGTYLKRQRCWQSKEGTFQTWHISESKDTN